MLNIYERILIIFLLVAFSCASQTATADEIETHDGHHYAVGRLEYAEHKILYAQSTGVVEELYQRSAHNVASGEAIAAIKPVDPTLPRQLLNNDTQQSMQISKLMVKKGDFVNQYQPIAQLVSADTIQVNATVLSHDKAQLSIGKDVVVFLNPDGDDLRIAGKVIAIHQQDGLIPLHKVEIGLIKGTCLKVAACKNALLVGAVVKIAI